MLHDTDDTQMALAVAARASGGSFGNGAAMRVAPLGLRYADDESELDEHAVRSALPTHCHPLAVERARLMAAATAPALVRPETSSGVDAS